MLKTENKEATTINNVISAKCLPGQTRLPYPNTDENIESSRKLPSLSKNRSGLKASGSGYTAGSCKIALQPVNTIHRRSRQLLTMYLPVQLHLTSFIRYHRDRV